MPQTQDVNTQTEEPVVETPAASYRAYKGVNVRINTDFGEIYVLPYADHLTKEQALERFEAEIKRDQFIRVLTTKGPKLLNKAHIIVIEVASKDELEKLDTFIAGQLEAQRQQQEAQLQTQREMALRAGRLSSPAPIRPA